MFSLSGIQSVQELVVWSDWARRIYQRWSSGLLHTECMRGGSLVTEWLSVERANSLFRFAAFMWTPSTEGNQPAQWHNKNRQWWWQKGWGSALCQYVHLSQCVRIAWFGYCNNESHKAVDDKLNIVKSCIKAAAYMQFFNFLLRLLFKCGFYSRVA